MSEKKESTVIPLVDIYSNAELEIKQDSLNYYLNQAPPEAWVKTHPYIANYRYLPIDKVEWLLRKFFKKYKIEVMREGSAFNGVYVVVRVWYRDPVSGELDFHDGIGAAQMQTSKGKSVADLGAINNGALAMAFPIAKTVAIKDACDHFGNVFGANLNRKDVLPTVIDEKLKESVDKKTQDELKRLKLLIEAANNPEEIKNLLTHVEKYKDVDENLLSLFQQKQKQLNENGKASI